MTKSVGWFCDECGEEVVEYITSVTSAGGGSIGSASFEHIKPTECRRQSATVRRRAGR